MRIRQVCFLIVSLFVLSYGMAAAVRLCCGYSLATQRYASIHEAGHVVVGRATNPNLTIDGLVVVTVGEAGQSYLGRAYVYSGSISTPTERLARATMAFAGPESAKILWGATSPIMGSDLKIVQHACEVSRPASLYGICSIEAASFVEQTESCLRMAERLAQKLVRRHAVTIMRLADRTMSQEPEWHGQMQVRLLDDVAIGEIIERAELGR